MVEPLPWRIPHSQVPSVPASPMETRLTILANSSSNACSIPLVVLGGVGRGSGKGGKQAAWLELMIFRINVLPRLNPLLTGKLGHFQKAQSMRLHMAHRWSKDQSNPDEWWVKYTVICNHWDSLPAKNCKVPVIWVIYSTQIRYFCLGPLRKMS